MKRILISLAIVAAGSAVCLTVLAARYEPTIRPGVFAGPLDVGGLTPQEARKKLRLWWLTEKVKPLTAEVESGKAKALETTASKVGLMIDDAATVAPLPLDDFWGIVGRTVSRSSPSASRFDLKLKPSGVKAEFLQTYVRESLGEPKPARVTLKDGLIVREPEISGYEIDSDGMPGAVLEALQAGGQFVIPIKEAPKRIPDEALAKITQVMAEYKTKFPVSQTSRNANLRLASGKLDGTVLMPGEEFSFNEIVGRRTIEQGYKMAGVYRNGKHDLGVGGGICQVSGTLYNAALLANLDIEQRSNHSMPVAYLPVGRDATVDYGTLDLRFKNPYDFPIAISSSFRPGMLAFQVLGIKDPGMEVTILVTDHSSWSRGVKYVEDPNLPPGKEKVIEKGSNGHSAKTWRVVKRNGVEVSRELISRSRYAGGVKIIARSPADEPPIVTPAKLSNDESGF